MRGDEARVVDAFCAWLAAQGWAVETEVGFVDIVADRDGVRLFAEAKGATSEPGLDVNTAYGQLLSRMPEPDDPRNRYALVIRDEPRSVGAATRVPAWVLDRMRMTVYAVAYDGAVRELHT